MPKEVGLLLSHLIAQNRLSKLLYIGDEPLSGKAVYMSSLILDLPSRHIMLDAVSITDLYYAIGFS